MPDELAKTRRRSPGGGAKRAVYVAFTLFVLAFVSVSTYEILSVALGFAPAAPLDSSGPSGPEASHECTDGVRAMADAVDAAAKRAIAAGTERAATDLFREALADTWNPREKPTEAACSAVPRGRDAFAAVLRLRQAQEGFVRRQVVEVAPLRRDVSAYLPR